MFPARFVTRNVHVPHPRRNAQLRRDDSNDRRMRLLGRSQHPVWIAQVTINTAMPRRLWPPRCCRTNAKSSVGNVAMQINSLSSAGNASSWIRWSGVSSSRRGKIHLVERKYWYRVSRLIPNSRAI